MTSNISTINTPVFQLNIGQRWALEKQQFKSKWFMVLLAIQTFLVLAQVIGSTVVLLGTNLEEATPAEITDVAKNTGLGLQNIALAGVILVCWSVEQARFWITGTYRRWLCDGLSRADLLAQMFFSASLRFATIAVLALLFITVELLVFIPSEIGVVFAEFGLKAPLLMVAEFWAKLLLYMAVVVWIRQYYAFAFIYVLSILESLVGYFTFSRGNWLSEIVFPIQAFDGIRQAYEMELPAHLMLGACLVVCIWYIWKRVSTVEL